MKNVAIQQEHFFKQWHSLAEKNNKKMNLS